jgi:broad specificity phosphatase PhoE
MCLSRKTSSGPRASFSREIRMRLILVRHGNTFEPGTQAVWVGARTDLPLAAKGRAQAEQVGDFLLRRRVPLAAIYCGPLKRTVDTASIVAETATALSPPRIQIDERLRELDYGLWEGLSTHRIVELHGADEIESWETESVWPAGAGWKPEKDVVLQNVQNLLNEWEATLRSGSSAAVLVVSSNGFFRLLAERMGVPPRDRKMATGHISIVSLVVPEHRWQVDAWNVSPSLL